MGGGSKGQSPPPPAPPPAPPAPGKATTTARTVLNANLPRNGRRGTILGGAKQSETTKGRSTILGTPLT